MTNLHNLAAIPQPPPVPTDSPSVHDAVMAQLEPDSPAYRVIEGRKAFGFRKYGTPLQVDNGRDHLGDWLQEKGDAACYAWAAYIASGYDPELAGLFVDEMESLKRLADYVDAISDD